jgi:nucleotide-binding universal stress UspA family protein
MKIPKPRARRAGAIRAILCPVDLSPQSRPALRAAAILAERFGAKIAILYVDDPLLAHAQRRYDEDALDRRTRDELRRFAERAGCEVADVEIAVGDAAEEILRAAERRRADIIVMGTQGRSGPKKFFFGSTAEGVLRRSHIPVLAVPPKRA